MLWSPQCIVSGAWLAGQAETHNRHISHLKGGFGGRNRWMEAIQGEIGRPNVNALSEKSKTCLKFLISSVLG